MSEYVPQLLETANSYPPDTYYKALLPQVNLADHIGPIFQKYDAFITPTTTYTDIPATGWQKDTVTVNGKECPDTTMAVIWNMYNRCPVMAVPLNYKVPTGLQIIGRPQDDPTVFKIARAFEKERPSRQNEDQI